MHRQAIKLVFSNPSYVAISISIFAMMMLLLLSAQEYLFFEPFLVFHIPDGMFPSFVSIIAVSALIGLVISFSIFQIRTKQASTKKVSAGLTGSFVGAGAGICTSCGSLALPIISVLGVAGATSLNFLTIYEFPIRLIAIAILIGTYFLMIKGINSECNIRTKK
ncbi:hypothetical protein AAA799E16_00592 [Marine Group I thaumarchaeote SCGC AAA799-E16]|nr:hypothetical protein AAA799E16_00592 [Marine Group I thaumarchaeote SCGC AAA799-E16]KFM16152.1 hypothetical protein AAA799D11_00956 [Marine Group I thaumarchaeote SCGC AAA799-D11]